MSHVIVFPEQDHGLPGDMIQVVLRSDGPSKIIIELTRESLDAIKRIAGSDYIRHLEMLFLENGPDPSQSLYSESTISNRSRSCI
jgi:hypothetical protein